MQIRIYIELLLSVSLFSSNLFFAESLTVCQHLERHRHDPDDRIQGFAYLDKIKRHVMFYNDLVYEFDFMDNIGRPYVAINTAGRKLENYFPGTYLLNGATIFNAYGLSNDSTNIFIIVSHPAFNMDNTDEQIDDYLKKLKGFIYDTEVSKAYAFDNSKLPMDFPFVYFSNNVDKVYLHQFHQYSFYPIHYVDPIGDLKNFASNLQYFAATQYEFRLTHRQVDVSHLEDNDKKMRAILRNKMALRAAFGFQDKLFFFTREFIYFMDEDKFEAPLDPHMSITFPMKKMPISDFFHCADDAEYEAIDYSNILLAILWIVFLIIALCICLYPLKWLYQDPKPNQIRSANSRRPRHIRSETSITNRSTTGSVGTSELIVQSSDSQTRSKYYQAAAYLAAWLGDSDDRPRTMIVDQTVTKLDSSQSSTDLSRIPSGQFALKTRGTFRTNREKPQT